MIRTEKDKSLIEIGWENSTLEEAVYLMANHDGESYIDGDHRTVVLVE